MACQGLLTDALDLVLEEQDIEDILELDAWISIYQQQVTATCRQALDDFSIDLEPSEADQLEQALMSLVLRGAALVDHPNSRARRVH